MMEIGRRPTPEWLEQWLRLPFYEERCKKHEKRYLVYYCALCREQPVCDVCWKKHESKQHQGHREILHVRSASRRAAIGIKKISEFLDISDIQEYSINGKYVVFLNPNTEGYPNPNHKLNCEICRRRLMDSKFRFCSIACKHMITERHIQIEEKNEGEKQQQRRLKRKMMIEKNDAERQQQPTLKRKMMIEKNHAKKQQQPTPKRKILNENNAIAKKMIDTEQCRSQRKTSRKGIPQRAPLK